MKEFDCKPCKKSTWHKVSFNRLSNIAGISYRDQLVCFDLTCVACGNTSTSHTSQSEWHKINGLKIAS